MSFTIILRSQPYQTNITETNPRKPEKRLKVSIARSDEEKETQLKVSSNAIKQHLKIRTLLLYSSLIKAGKMEQKEKPQQGKTLNRATYGLKSSGNEIWTMARAKHRRQRTRALLFNFFYFNLQLKAETLV